jgi:hypothetical protein
MNLKLPFIRRATRPGVALICALAIGPGDLLAYALPASTLPQTGLRTIRSADQLDSLVAPIALYPDPLLAQLLAASTYPAELQELDEWLEDHLDLSGHALADAVAGEPWDPSVQAMSAFPDVVRQLTQNMEWTTELGEAVLDQESDVMDAVQRMRQRAEDAGYLLSNPQQVIQKRVVDNRTVIAIEPPSPQIVYVPVYGPAMIWGAPVYPWPRIIYPRRGFWAGAGIGFGSGVAVGSFWGRGGWGWHLGWGRGRNNIFINRNAFFVRNNSFYRGRGINTWRHNPGRGRVANRRGPRSRGVATSGRGNMNRRNINRGNVNRRDVNRPAGTSGRNNVRRGQPRSGNVNRRNVNRPAGTSGRNNVRRSQPRSGAANRGNRPIGTAGRGSRGGNRNVGGGGGGRRGGGGGQRGGGGGRRR